MTEHGFRSFGAQLDFLRALILHDERGDGPVPSYIISHASREVTKTTIRRLLRDGRIARGVCLGGFRAHTSVGYTITEYGEKWFSHNVELYKSMRKQFTLK
jgi:hypothetical protein